MSAARRWFTVALPKGRLESQTTQLLVGAGLLAPDQGSSRTLLLEDEQRRIRYVWLRPGDALTYVERGVAALGVVGKDVLVEAGAPVDELADLGIGRCRVSLAVPATVEVGADGLPVSAAGDRHLRIATHLPRITEQYFHTRARPIEVIYLRGSVEIAPKLGLADAVVDIVQTGTTLRANGLRETTTLLEISSRLVAHPQARRSGDERFDELVTALIDAPGRPAGDPAKAGRRSG